MTLISKFFILPPHSKIQVKLDFWKISNWANNETIYIYLDSHKAIEQQVGLLPTGLNICGGNDYILSIDESFSHNFENLQIIIAANIAIQGTIQGFWGIKNFRLFIQTCPAGCLICQEGDQRFDCLKWTLYTSSLTETNIELFNYEGWIVQNGQQQKTSNCQMLPMLCGPTLCGMNTIIKYDYILPPHFKLRIRFRQYFIDSWDLEHAYVIVNDQIIIDKSFQFQSSLRNYSLCGQSRFNDLSDTLDFEVSHTQELITFQLTNSLDQLFDDESFGIRDFRIYLYCQFGQFPSQQCSQFCGDNIVQETEECDDGNSIPFDGCHNCQYNCVQGCSNCIKGICLNCYEEWDYELISQQCKWIGVQSQQNQNYSCYNNGNCINQQEEQQQLYYQVCSLNCKLCYQDICLECQVGYNLLGGQCQEICGLSAISMFIYPNCQCDQNCLLCNFGMCQQCIDTYTLFDDKCLVICGDGLVTNGIEECDDKNEIPYDGCFQCIYQCSEQCSICEQGVCKDICKNGMPKIDGQCQSFCGNQIIEENEQCDDNNSIQYDGCYLCQFSCPLYCSNCDEGKCYECNQNYHYDQSSLSCYSICGDGILTSETEQCDDNNIFSGDGCSSTCQVEQDWICIYHEDYQLFILKKLIPICIN
ncbi:unnamed protein product [Paramecium sonneborni]|uniref:Insulin-like growth factor binding protein, N-terminal n=1 Tax=Paramecium sonneborni TaxID=65129 RepID=A0A8S1JYF3_9CILI|nr:unnamed protein product [Paramecium sonneborni]